MALTEGSHSKGWFTMFLNYVTQLYFCAARRPVLLFFFFCSTQQQQEEANTHMWKYFSSGEESNEETRGCVVNQLQTTGSLTEKLLAWFQREMEVLEEQTSQVIEAFV